MDWITPRPVIAAATLALAVSALPAAPVDAETLDALVQTLDERREAMNIPGMAIAIVKDGEVILARGLGVADIETERPVTPETIFCIGSSSKTFTSALVGIGVDRHELDWEAPVSTFIPWFKLPEAEGSETVNLIDLLSHRTGLTRMSLLWYGGTATREQIYATVAEASYYHPFRESWFYNNVTFAAAGFAAAAVENTTWEDLLQRDILDPVGMTDTSPAHKHLADNPNAALGYLWDTETEAYKQLPPRELSLIAPAGAINSNAYRHGEVGPRPPQQRRPPRRQATHLPRFAHPVLDAPRDHAHGWGVRARVDDQRLPGHRVLRARRQHRRVRFRPRRHARGGHRAHGAHERQRIAHAIRGHPARLQHPPQRAHRRRAGVRRRRGLQRVRGRVPLRRVGG